MKSSSELITFVVHFPREQYFLSSSLEAKIELFIGGSNYTLRNS